MARRVLFVAWAPFFSGAERALLLTLRSLDPSRYTPFVLAGTDGEFASQVRAMGVLCGGRSWGGVSPVPPRASPAVRGCPLDRGGPDCRRAVPGIAHSHERSAKLPARRVRRTAPWPPCGIA